MIGGCTRQLGLGRVSRTYSDDSRQHGQTVLET
jgi:hypothetical protein